MKEFLTIILVISIMRLIGAYIQEEKLYMYQNKNHKLSDLVILLLLAIMYIIGIIFVWSI